MRDDNAQQMVLRLTQQGDLRMLPMALAGWIDAQQNDIYALQQQVRLLQPRVKLPEQKGEPDA